MKCYKIKNCSWRYSLIIISLITALSILYLISTITIEDTIIISKSINNDNIIKSFSKHNSLNIINIIKCENCLSTYYNKFLSINNDAHNSEALEFFYSGYENALRPKPTVNRIQGLNRNRISKIFDLLVNRSVFNKANNDLALLDLGIGDSGVYTMVAVSLGHQVVAVSSNFCSIEILKRSLQNISNTLTGCTQLDKITFLNNAVRQISGIKIPFVSQICYIGDSAMKINKATHLESIRLSDIVLTNTFKKFIITVDLQAIDFSMLFDDLKKIMFLNYEIPTIILTNWKKLNESIQNQISRFLQDVCYSPHLAPSISAELASGLPWPNELYWYLSPSCNVDKFINHTYSAVSDNILKEKVNCIQWFPHNYEVERFIEQSNFHRSQLHNKFEIIPIYIHDPNIDTMISKTIEIEKTWNPELFEQIMNAIQERSDLHYIDINANIGTFALQVAVLSKRKVIAIDSNKNNLGRLLKSAKINKLDSIYLFKNAITDKSCEQMNMFESEKHNIGGWQMPSLKTSVDNNQSIIKSATFDDLVLILKSIGIKQAVVKIDIEGK
jgi:FkbM family methyltransferase